MSPSIEGILFRARHERALTRLHAELTGDEDMATPIVDLDVSKNILVGVEHSPTTGESIVVLHMQGQKFQFSPEAARIVSRLLTQVSYIIDPPKGAPTAEQLNTAQGLKR